MPSPDKNEPSKITGSRVVGGNYTRHEQLEFTCSAVQLALFARVIRHHDGIHQLVGFLRLKVTLPHRKPINGLVLSTFCFLTNQRKVQILDQQQTNSQVIVSGVPSRRENKGTPDRRLAGNRDRSSLLT